MMTGIGTVQQTSNIHVAASGGQGARAMACLLADIGQVQGFQVRGILAGVDPQRVARPGQLEQASVRFITPSEEAATAVTAVMEPQLMNVAGDGMLLVNSAQPICTETVRSVDAEGIARALGIPAYLPMVGAVARAAGWTDLERVKATVRLALEDTAPYWADAGVAGVEAGFRALA